MTASFFETTAAYKRQNTGLFDFITPTAAAMWNLRWQVQGYLGAVPQATKQDLEGRFLTGADHRKIDLRRANLRRAATEHTWDEQLEQFARYMLFVAVALYEGWLDQTLALFPRPKTTADQLQRPSRGVGGRTKDGVREALTALTEPQSSTMNKTFTPCLRRGKKYALKNLDTLLISYRYFKECRNALLHQAGVADARLEQLSAELSALTPVSLGTKAVPEHHRCTAGDTVVLTLQGVVGFSDVVLRIVSTLDAELSSTPQGERHLLQRWRDAYGRQFLPANAARRDRRLVRMSQNLGLPSPDSPLDLYRLLRDSGLVV